MPNTIPEENAKGYGRRPGATALWEALLSEQWPVALKLIESGVEPLDVRDRRDLTPLMRAVSGEKTCSEELVRAMVARPDGLKTVTWTRGSSKTTAADYARVRGHLAIGAFLQDLTRKQHELALPGACPTCGEKVKPKPNLVHLRERWARGGLTRSGSSERDWLWAIAVVS